MVESNRISDQCESAHEGRRKETRIEMWDAPEKNSRLGRRIGGGERLGQPWGFDCNMGKVYRCQRRADDTDNCSRAKRPAEVVPKQRKQCQVRCYGQECEQRDDPVVQREHQASGRKRLEKAAVTPAAPLS